MIKATEEQVTILETLKSGNKYTRVIAVAGSGKTTTSLFLAESMPDHEFTLLTYNKFLADETAKKIKKCELKNIKVSTFHSYAGRLFGKVIFDDQSLIECLDETKDEEIDDCDVDIDIIGDCCDTTNVSHVFIFDEFQDMTIPLFRLCKLIMVQNNDAQFMIFGDPRQCIYAYNGADARYLTKFEDILGVEVVDCKLSVSYRVSNSVSQFINNVCYGKTVISGNETGQKPYYQLCNSKELMAEWVIDRIKFLVLNGVSPDKIFIIAASAKHKGRSKKEGESINDSPIVKIANKLHDAGIMTFIDIDGHPADHKCLKHKVVITSIHKSKGREREYVFFIGFDETYFGMYNKNYITCEHNYEEIDNQRRLIMPNELYVGLTRATKMLIILVAMYDPRVPQHHILMPPCKFIVNPEIIDTFANVNKNIFANYMSRRNYWAKQMSFPDRRSVSVTDLIGSIPSVVKYRIMKDCIKATKHIDIMKNSIPLKSKSKQSNNGLRYHEQVSDINGIASTIAAAYNSSKTINDFQSKIIAIDLSQREMLTDTYSRSDILTLSTDIQTTFRGHDYRRSQIKDENWLSDETLFELSARIIMNTSLDYCEYPVKYEYDTEKYIHGLVDIISNTGALYEIKTTSVSSVDDFIQAALYRLIVDKSKLSLVSKETETDTLDVGDLVSFKYKGSRVFGVIDKWNETPEGRRACVYTNNSEYILVKSGKKIRKERVIDDAGSTIVFNCRNNEKWSVDIIDPELLLKMCLTVVDKMSDTEFLEYVNANT